MGTDWVADVGGGGVAGWAVTGIWTGAGGGCGGALGGGDAAAATGWAGGGAGATSCTSVCGCGVKPGLRRGSIPLDST